MRNRIAVLSLLFIVFVSCSRQYYFINQDSFQFKKSNFIFTENEYLHKNIGVIELELIVDDSVSFLIAPDFRVRGVELLGFQTQRNNQNLINEKI